MTEDTVYCRDCGSEIAARAEICPECGIRQQPPPEAADSGGSDTDPGVAAASSFVIPGLGQALNGELTKGIILGTITVAFAITGLGLIIAIPIWLWLVYDAYSTADTDGAQTGGGAGGAQTASEVEARRANAANAAVVEALEWYEAEHDRSQTLRVRRRFQNVADISSLTEEELTHLIDVIDAYQEAVESGRFTPMNRSGMSTTYFLKIRLGSNEGSFDRVG